MSIKHKFYHTSFGEGFQTQNAILYNNHYEPEIMVLGTFNPNTPKTNCADFFYGRNYFWSGLKNLFFYNNITLVGTRMPKNGQPKKVLNPDLQEILKMCFTLKLTFADLILEVLHNNKPDYHILDNDNICYDNKTFNLIQDDKKNQVEGLVQLDKLSQVKWNTDNIIKYLCENSNIKTIYFTRQAKGIWLNQWKNIIKEECLQDRTFTNLFTPSGQGKPVLNSMSRLLKHWVHNENPDFGKLDNVWLTNQGVKLDNF